MALTVAATEVAWVSTLLSELGVPCGRPVAYTDSAAAKDMCKKQLSKVKHMQLRHYFLKNLVEDGHLEVRKLATELNPADIVTRPMGTAVLGNLQQHFSERPLQLE